MVCWEQTEHRAPWPFVYMAVHWNLERVSWKRPESSISAEFFFFLPSFHLFLSWLSSHDRAGSQLLCPRWMVCFLLDQQQNWRCQTPGLVKKKKKIAGRRPTKVMSTRTETFFFPFSRAEVYKRKKKKRQKESSWSERRHTFGQSNFANIFDRQAAGQKDWKGTKSQ